MLNFLRKGATSLYIKLFLLVIVIVFIFWGIGNFTSERKNFVAKVNGNPITLKEFQEYYNFQVFKLKQTFGELSAEDLAKLKLKDQILDELIRIKLLENQAEKFDIKITPVEITYAISQIPFFQENGKFSPAKYQSILRELRVSPEFFENLIKTDLLYQRLKLLLTAPILVSEEEIKEYLKYSKQILEIVEIDFPLKNYIPKIKYTEEDLKNYYLAHRDIYKDEAKVKIAYMFIPYQGKVEVAEEEIKNYYEKNIERFKKPFRVKLKRIFIPGSDPETFKKVQAIRAEIKSLSDFSKFGIKESEWFEESSFPEILREIIKSSHPKEIVGPIKVSSGFLILGIEELQPERIFKLSEVKSEIRKFLEREKIINKTKEKVNTIYAEVVKANGLSIWAESKNIQLQQTNWLTKKDLSEMFNNFKLAQEIFNSPKGEFLSPVETTQGILLIEIKDKKPERTLSFEEAKERVKKDFLKDKGKELCETEAQKLINELKTERGIDKNFSGFKNFSVKELKIKRSELNHTFSAEISQKLINIGKEGVIEPPLWDKDNLKVFFVKNIIPFEGEIKDKEVLEISSKILKEKREIWFKIWYQHLRDNVKIKIYPIFEKL